MNALFESHVASSRRATLATALLASALAMTAAPAHAQVQICNGCGGDLDNGWVNPSGNPTGFEIDFTGNVTNTIPQQITDDPLVNAFACLDDWDLQNQVQSTTVGYDAGANLTRVNFSTSGQLPDPVPSNWGGVPCPDQYGVTYHFGFNGGYPIANTAARFGLPSLGAPASVHWIYADGTTEEVPYLQPSWAGTAKKGAGQLWAAIYTETNDQSTGGWSLVPYLPSKTGGAVRIRLTNASQTPVTIGNTGYELGLVPPNDPECSKSPQCPANQAALDMLNGVAMPVPGQVGSPFTQVKVSKKTIPPGGSIVLSLK